VTAESRRWCSALRTVYRAARATLYQRNLPGNRRLNPHRRYGRFSGSGDGLLRRMIVEGSDRRELNSGQHP
jgi:hypothetical protein